MCINLRKSVNSIKTLLWCSLFLSGIALNAQVTLSGRITFWKDQAPLTGVPVFITGTVNEMTLTDSEGNYHVTVPSGGSYAVRPFANAYPLNSVTTFDVVLGRLFAQFPDTLESPYAAIALDVDYSEDFSLDTMRIGRLILNIDDQFESGESWCFVPADHIFTDPSFPFPFPRNIAFNNVTTDQTGADFIGVKLGDLNGSAITNLNEWMTDYYNFPLIKGSATWDVNENCTYDPSEAGLKDWKVSVSGAAGNFVTNTYVDGTYRLRVPAGDYTVTFIPPSALWSVCTPPQNISVQLEDTLSIPFSAQAAIICPALEVDIASFQLRRCFPGSYYVRYTNNGTATAENASVIVELDPYLTYTASSIPGTPGAGNSYEFPLGDVPPGAVDYFLIEVAVSCDAVLGQTHCTTAHIFPDSVCTPPGLWDGSELRITGHCTGESVEFTVTNEGADMSAPADYVIIEDIMIQIDGDELQLGHGESETFTVSANGSTWRMEVDQSTSHPWSTRASAAVEGCGTNDSGTTSLGYVNIFPQDDSSPFIDEDCSENTGSFDPNDKQGFPKGISNEHFIPKGEELEYLIRFQNTGTDTAFTVMVMDTISALFDIKTLHAGPSSHPYTFNLLESGVAQFVFSNIMLPDSNVNEAASHGFVKFTISPKADLPDGTKLENQAGIYFDFNEPVITNSTLHTLGEPEQYLEVSQVKNLQSDVDLLVFPNPATTQATFKLKSANPLQGNMILYDFRGRETTRVLFTNNVFKVDTAQLPTGTYMFVIQSGGSRLASGKIIVKND